MKYQSKLSGTIKLYSPPPWYQADLNKFAIAVGVDPSQIRGEIEEYIRVNGESPEMLKAFVLGKVCTQRSVRAVIEKALQGDRA